MLHTCVQTFDVMEKLEVRLNTAFGYWGAPVTRVSFSPAAKLLNKNSNSQFLTWVFDTSQWFKHARIMNI